jgi:hypothetical protein
MIHRKTKEIRKGYFISKYIAKETGNTPLVNHLKKNAQA